MNKSREEELFALALEQPAEKRLTFLDAVCADDAGLRRRIEALLAAHDHPDSRLPEGLACRESVAGDEGSLRLQDEAVGQMIGRYKLLERVGEGGCGVVYVAEQMEPVRRRVAVKVIKLGMDTRQVVARFEAERQALAMMDHPNIARVLDAGATEAGRPYFVMELVRGMRITGYCDQNNLSTKDRLDLFTKVCHALQHAHQKGIIHRDIKPSNILVTLHDGVPVPKVIDFGIAKATEGRLTDSTVYTQLHQFIGTPAYMSPEQAEMSGLDIDTRSDIYSLGVLLYELLAGSTPFDGRELISLGLDQMRRVIRETEPLRPSTKLASLDREQLTTTASRRSADPPRLLRQLQGDLDWIVMKCLEKDRNRRYETANGLAADLQRHLENEPVKARPPSAIYRFQKAWRRNKLAGTAGVAVTVAVVAGAVASSVQAIRARHAEALANVRLSEAIQAREDAEQISRFLEQMFQSASPEKDGRAITVAETLDRAVRQMETELVDQPERRAKLQAALAGTYASLGLHAPALGLRQEAHRFWLGKAGPDDPRTLSVSRDLAESYSSDGQPQPAFQIFEDLLPRLRRVHGPDHTNVLHALTEYANVLQRLGRDRAALEIREKNLQAMREVFGPEHRDTLVAMQNLEVSYHRLNMIEKARPLQEEVAALSRKVLGPDHPVTLSQLGNLAVDYAATERNAEAIVLLEDTLAKQRRVIGPEHPNTVHSMQTLGQAYNYAGRKEEALRMREEVVEITRRSQGPEHPDILYRMRALANSYMAVGRTNDALQLREETLALARRILGDEHPDYADALAVQAYAHFTDRKLNEAIRDAEEALRLSRKVIDTNSFAFSQRARWLGHYYLSAGRPEDAIPLFQEVLVLARKNNGPANTNTLAAMWPLAEACASDGRYEEALETGEHVLAVSRQLHPPEHAEVIRAIDHLAYYNHRVGRSNEAVRLGEEMLALSRKVLGAEDTVTLRRANQMATYFAHLGKVEQALQLRRDIVNLRRTKNGPEHGSTVEAIKAVADVYAELGRWKEARAELAPLMQMERLPSASTIALMSLAALDVLLGEHASFEAHCKVMLGRFGSTTNSEVANRIAKACLLLPLHGEERKHAVELAERGVQLGAASSQLHWYLLAETLALYRAGNWTNSIASGEQALKLSSGNPDASREVALHAILSMARQRSGHGTEARRSFTEAGRILEENWPRVDQGKLGNSWHNVLIAHLLAREAKELIAADIQAFAP